MMLEKSIVCYGTDIAKNTGTILGLESLLRPFQWTSVLVPILPEILIETLEVPMPVLASITRLEYFKLRKIMSEEEIQNRIWVNTDEGKVEWYRNFPPMYSFNDLKSRLTDDWEQLRKAIKK
jgi:hypothetical protein